LPHNADSWNPTFSVSFIKKPDPVQAKSTSPKQLSSAISRFRLALDLAHGGCRPTATHVDGSGAAFAEGEEERTDPGHQAKPDECSTGLCLATALHAVFRAVGYEIALRVIVVGTAVYFLVLA